MHVPDEDLQALIDDEFPHKIVMDSHWAEPEWIVREFGPDAFQWDDDDLSWVFDHTARWTLIYDFDITSTLFYFRDAKDAVACKFLWDRYEDKHE